ncbi:phage minor head protein [Heyndrickxia faecalis]|uniref:phage minor head protein n=2 Tax=Bacillaceae TaxID=186817 RepID=UPI0031019393
MRTISILDSFRAWQNKRNAKRYLSSVRSAINSQLTGGRETLDKWERQFRWYDGIIRREHLRSKNVMDSLKIIRDINPDASMAIWNFLRLSNQGHELECLKPTGSPDKQGLDYLNNLSARVGRLYGGGADQLINVLNLTGYTQGAIALEVELNEQLNDVVDFHAVDPATLDFRKNRETGEIELVQKQLDGTYRVMNQNQVFYQPFDPDIGDPYGRSPILPVLQIVFFQVEVLKDLKAVAHHQGHARFDISVMEESILKNIPPQVAAQGEDGVRSFVSKYIGDIEKAFKQLKPDDNFFHTDSVKVDMAGGTQGKSMDATALINVINQQVVTSLKQLPILLGRNEGTTETHGSIQWQIYVAGIESIQRGVKRIMERAYNVALQVQGRQSTARLTFNKIRTTDRQAEATAAATETNTLITQVNQGWVTNDEAAMQAVGHKAVSEPVYRLSAPAETAKGDETGISRAARSYKKKVPLMRTRAQETEDEYVKDVEASWASDIAKETSKATDDFYDFLQEELDMISENLKNAPEMPTRLLVEMYSRADITEPIKAFIDWVKKSILKSKDRTENWADKLLEWLKQISTKTGEITLAELTADIDFNEKDEKLLRALQERSLRQAELIQGVTDEDVIKTLWDVVMDEKYTIQKATAALQESFAFSKSRAQTIARTEILGAARTGQFYGDVQSGMVIGKTWRSAHDSKTRHAHAAADGQTVKFDQTFIVGGEELMFPGDTSHGASAKNVIQCRCFYTRVLKGEEDTLEELMKGGD